MSIGSTLENYIKKYNSAIKVTNAKNEILL